MRFTITFFLHPAVSAADPRKNAGEGLTPLHWALPPKLWADIKNYVLGLYVHRPSGGQITPTRPDFANLWFKLSAVTEEDALRIVKRMEKHLKSLSVQHPRGYIKGKAPERAYRPGDRAQVTDPEDPTKPWTFYIPVPVLSMSESPLPLAPHIPAALSMSESPPPLAPHIPAAHVCRPGTPHCCAISPRAGEAGDMMRRESPREVFRSLNPIPLLIAPHAVCPHCNWQWWTPPDEALPRHVPPLIALLCFLGLGRLPQAPQRCRGKRRGDPFCWLHTLYLTQKRLRTTRAGRRRYRSALASLPIDSPAHSRRRHWGQTGTPASRTKTRFAQNTEGREDKGARAPKRAGRRLWMRERCIRLCHPIRYRKRRNPLLYDSQVHVVR